MLFQFECEGETGVVTLTGPLTIGRADEIRSILLGNRKKVDRMTVKLADVSEVDLTLFQILCSARRLFAEEKKQFLFSPESDEKVVEMMRRCGFTWKNDDIELNSECL
jgi:anti-anti-sigma regulatory factor